MTAFVENHTFGIQIALFLFILCFFWILESISLSQSLKDKYLHTLVNAKFLIFVIPIQIILAVILLSVSAKTVTYSFGLLYHLPIEKNGVTYYLIAFLLIDFFNFIYHYLMHKIPLGWRFHQVHHSDMDVDISTTFREHPGETFFRVTFFIITVFVLGISPWIIILFQLMESTSNLISHSKIKLPENIDRFVSLIFVTPNSHSIHHHYKLPHTDANYGDILSIWDHIFKTASRLNQKKIVYGIDTHMNPVYNANFKLLIKRPFRSKKKSPLVNGAVKNTLILIFIFSIQGFYAQKTLGNTIKDSTVIETDLNVNDFSVIIINHIKAAELSSV
ncbi:sterol desaturase family protein [Chryseobacterium sp.]|nr:sterol desaturase family protein [Chryseobacterium sp.]